MTATDEGALGSVQLRPLNSSLYTVQYIHNSELRLGQLFENIDPAVIKDFRAFCKTGCLHCCTLVPGAGPLVTQGSGPAGGTGAQTIHGVTDAPGAPTLLPTPLTVPAVGALVLALNNGYSQDIN